MSDIEHVFDDYRNIAEEAMDLHSKGMSLKDIADKLGVKKVKIRKFGKQERIDIFGNDSEVSIF